MTGKCGAQCVQNNMQHWQGVNCSQAHKHIILQRCWMDSEYIFVFYDHFGVFVCLCLCTSPSEPIHSWQSRILYFSTVTAAAHRHSTFGLRCAMPAGTQPIRTSAPCLKTSNIQSEHHHPSNNKTNNQQPIRISTFSNGFLAAVQGGLISPSWYPSHHW